jgi:methylmalonyl-CoA mutase cobalamin-binding domain/chain
LVPALLDELRQAGMLHVLVVVGGIIPPQVGTHSAGSCS